MKRRDFYVLIAIFVCIALIFYMYSSSSKVDMGTLPQHPPDEKLLHPSKSLDDLWFKLQPDLLIRRLCYFDTRNNSHVTVVFLTMFDIREKIEPTLHALLVYDNNTKLCLELEPWTRVGILNTKESEFFITVLYRTKVPIGSDTSPLHALIGKDCDEANMSHIPIQDDQSQERLTYGVCLHKGLYNLHDPQLLVDWVELNMALGAEIITVYLQDVPESYYTVMLPYIRKGIVEVLDWNLKPPLIKSYTKHWGQSGTISECIYRNIYRVKYLALIDVDEFIVPQQRHSVVDMLKDLEELSKSVNPASFIFYNTYVYNNGKSLPEVKTAKKCESKHWPRYYTHTLRVADPAKEHLHFKYHKIIVKTEAVNGAWYHWTTSVKEGYNETRYHVPEQYGLTLHYRVPERGRRKRSKQYFLMSRYFKETISYLQNC